MVSGGVLAATCRIMHGTHSVNFEHASCGGSEHDDMHGAWTKLRNCCTSFCMPVSQRVLSAYWIGSLSWGSLSYWLTIISAHCCGNHRGTTAYTASSSASPRRYHVGTMMHAEVIPCGHACMHADWWHACRTEHTCCFPSYFFWRTLHRAWPCISNGGLPWCCLSCVLMHKVVSYI